jgi:hypothetical protein
MSSLKTFASNISSKETEVLNAVKTKSQTEDEAILPLGSLRLKSQISTW